MLRFASHVFLRSTVLQLATGGLLLAASVAGGCSTYSPDLLNGSALGNAGNMSDAHGGAGTSGGSNATAGAGADVAHAGSDNNPGDGGDAGAGNAGGSKAGSGGGGTPAAGSGGTVGTAGSGVAGFGTTGGSTTASPDLIDDFEDGDKLIRIINSPRRDGIWDTNNDMTVGGTEAPAPGMFLPTELAATNSGTDAAAPYAGDSYAAHLSGKGFTSFGAYMNVSMRSVAVYADTPTYDASGYKGISFIAKVGSTASAIKSMRVRFISGDTDPRGKKCSIATGAPQSTLCYNHYFATVPLTTAWKLYELDFDNDFVQGTDGMSNPTIDTKEMFGLEFYFSTSTTFDLWLDDLTFSK